MVRTKIGDIKHLIAFTKGSPPLSLIKWLPVSGLVLILSINPSFAQKSIIESVYFNTDHSLVIETKEKSPLEFSSLEARGDAYVMSIINSKLARNVEAKLSNQGLAIELNKQKANVELSFKPKPGEVCTVTPKTILEGLAYELELKPPLEVAQNWQAIVPEVQLNSEVADVHQLSVQAPDPIEHNTLDDSKPAGSKTEVDKFIRGLDAQLVTSLEADTKFREESSRKSDSASLEHLADTLAKKGHSQEALSAYHRALELNAENINAKLGLAELSQDKVEKLTNYLDSVSDKALLEIGSQWFDQAYQSHDLKSVAKALVSFQLAVLKNPKNPEYRYRYAQVLERAGADFWSQATKRYLEAAALAKLEYLAGNKTAEPLLRNATESLIRVLSEQGEFASAAKYCAVYMNLGFKNFIDGKAVLAVLKEVEANRNPFKQELGQRVRYNGGPSA